MQLNLYVKSVKSKDTVKMVLLFAHNVNMSCMKNAPIMTTTPFKSSWKLVFV